MPDSISWRRSIRTILYSNGDSDSEDGDNDRNQASPSEPGDLAKGLNAAASECDDPADGHEYSSTDRMR